MITYLIHLRMSNAPTATTLVLTLAEIQEIN